jgi:hypothetical protein
MIGQLASRMRVGGEPLHARVGRVATTVARTPEMRLVAAVLEEALRCVEHHALTRRGPRKAFREARAWFFDSDQDGPFAFETVSALLGLDPSALRKEVRLRLAAAGWTYAGSASTLSPNVEPRHLLVAPPEQPALPTEQDAA